MSYPGHTLFWGEGESDIYNQYILNSVDKATKKWKVVVVVGGGGSQSLHYKIILYKQICQKIRGILALAIDSIVYMCTFSKEINGDESSHCPEDFQHDLLYRLLCPEIFLYQRVNVFPLNGLSFSLRFVVVNPLASSSVKIILAKTCFSTHITYSSVNFIWFALLSHQKFDDRPLLGIRPNKKIPKLFFLRYRKGVAFCRQYIVGLVGTGRMNTHETEKRHDIW